MISFGNVYLYSRVATAINKTSLDIRIGFVHSAMNRNQTLNLDIAEIFKPIIVDRVIFTMINKKMIQSIEHFEISKDGGIWLNREGKRLFIRELDKKMYQKQTSGQQTLSFDTRIRNEVYGIYRYVIHGDKYKPYKYF